MGDARRAVKAQSVQRRRAGPAGRPAFSPDYSCRLTRPAWRRSRPELAGRVGGAFRLVAGRRGGVVGRRAAPSAGLSPAAFSAGAAPLSAGAASLPAAVVGGGLAVAGGEGEQGGSGECDRRELHFKSCQLRNRWLSLTEPRGGRKSALYRRAKLCLDETPRAAGGRSCRIRDPSPCAPSAFAGPGAAAPMDKAPQMEFAPFRIESWARTHQGLRPQP